MARNATHDQLSVALLTYSTRPRGSVVHTLALAEALAEAGQRVTVWTLGRGGDSGFFRPVGPFDEWWTRTTALAGPLATILAQLPHDAGRPLRTRAQERSSPTQHRPT